MTSTSQDKLRAEQRSACGQQQTTHQKKISSIMVGENIGKMNATTPTTNERSVALATPPLYPSATSGKGTVSMTVNADNLLIETNSQAR